MDWDVRRNPGLLKLDLFCRGIRLDPSCRVGQDSRQILRTRAGLGSGIEVLLPDGLRANVPVKEPFAASSPYSLHQEDDRYHIYRDERRVAPVELAVCPNWYSDRTSSGKPMTQIGTLQGTYLGIYLGRVCDFWREKPDRVNCRFCSTGLNLGQDDAIEKRVEEVLEVVRAARRESGITYVDINTGFIAGDNYLALVGPFVKAIKKETGLLLGVQCPPESDFSRYDELRALGVNRVSFCFELFDPARFSEVCPGKAHFHGQARYLKAIEYCVPIFDTTNGEIVAGLEPPESSLAAIEWLTSRGAIPTVCVFRPLIGTDYATMPPPRTEDMVPIFRRLYEACMERGLPIGIAPNIRVSLIVLPDEGRYFVDDPSAYRWHETKLLLMKGLFRAKFRTSQWLRGA